MIMLVGTQRQEHLATRVHPKAGTGLEYLVKFLELVRCEQQSKDLVARSPYRFRSATFDIIKWCIQKGLVQRREQYIKYYDNPRKLPKRLVQPLVFYKITPNGGKLLELIS